MFFKIYFDILNDNTFINIRGYKFSGICFSFIVDLYLIVKRVK